LDQVLARIPRWANENVLVGFDTADDAGVYKLTPECALVQTVDWETHLGAIDSRVARSRRFG
jgi:selenide,water dikinase